MNNECLVTDERRAPFDFRIVLSLFAIVLLISCSAGHSNPYRERVTQTLNQAPPPVGSVVHGGLWYFDGGSRCPDGEGYAMLISTPMTYPHIVAAFDTQFGATWAKSAVKGDVAWQHSDGKVIDRFVISNDEQEIKLRFDKAYAGITLTSNSSMSVYLLRVTSAPICNP